MKEESGLWRLRFSFFLLFILFFNFVSSERLGISPPEMDLMGDINERICGDFEFFSNGDVVLNSRWSGEESRNLNDFVLENLDLTNVFEKEFYVQGKTNKKICFISKTGGRFYGVLIANLKNKDVGVGSWINLKVLGQSEENSAVQFNEENIVLKGKVDRSSNIFLVILILIFIDLLFTFFILLIFRKKRFYRED